MKPTPENPCVAWEGGDRKYQAAAARSLELDGNSVTPYSWITPMCGNWLCLTSSHLKVHAPLRLSYPAGQCIYCGRSGWSKDHLFPRNWTGDAVRTFTVTVPACGTCNSVLGDVLTWSITERRAICHQRLRHRFRKALACLNRTPAELDEYGPTLRAVIEDGMAKRSEVERMLRWPEDAAYDQRALEQSGIEDPYIAGLILSPDDPDLLAVIS